MRITKELMESKGACKSGLDKFLVEWPDGAELTMDVCKRAEEIGVSLNWAAKKLFTAAGYKAYESGKGTKARRFYVASKIQ